jgi:hypothetical protein
MRTFYIILRFGLILGVIAVIALLIAIASKPAEPATIPVRLCASSYCIDTLGAKQPRQLALRSTLRWRLSGATPWLSSRDTVARDYHVAPALYGRPQWYVLTWFTTSPSGGMAGGFRYYTVTLDSLTGVR